MFRQRRQKRSSFLWATPAQGAGVVVVQGSLPFPSEETQMLLSERLGLGLHLPLRGRGMDRGGCL